MKPMTQAQADYLVFIINAYGDGQKEATRKNVFEFSLTAVKPLVKRAIAQTGNQHYKDLLTLLESVKKETV